MSPRFCLDVVFARASISSRVRCAASVCLFLPNPRASVLIHARRGRKKNPVFFAGRAVFRRPGGHTDPPPGTAAGHTSDFALRKSGGRHTSPLCSGKVHPGTGLFDFALVKSGRVALLRFAVKKSGGRHTSPLCSGKVWRAGSCSQPPGRGVPGEGEVGFLGVPGGDRAPLTREFPTN